MPPENQQTSPSSTSTAPLTQPASQSSSSNGNGAGWLPEDVAKAYPSVATKYKSVGDLAKAYTDIEKYQGGSVRIPAADAKPEDWDAFYNKVGRPEAPDKYEIKFPENTPVDENLLGSFRGTAHQLGLTQRQAAGLAEWFANQSAGMADASAARQGQWMDELKQEWGWATERNMAIANKGYNAAFVDNKGNQYPELAKLSAVLDETGLGNHPVLIKAFHWLAQARGEDQFVEEQGPSLTDRNAAEEEIARLTPPKNVKLTPQQLAEFSKPETQRRLMELRQIIDDFNQSQAK